MVHPETRRELPDGEQGLLLARGPGVSEGYFDDEAATAAAFSGGWFDTGDLGWRAPQVPASRLTSRCSGRGDPGSSTCLQTHGPIRPMPRRHWDDVLASTHALWWTLWQSCAATGRSRWPCCKLPGQPRSSMVL